MYLPGEARNVSPLHNGRRNILSRTLVNWKENGQCFDLSRFKRGAI